MSHGAASVPSSAMAGRARKPAPTVCKECDIDFGTNSRLRLHTADTHQGQVQVTGPNGAKIVLQRQADGMFHCFKCNVATNKPRVMQRHSCCKVKDEQDSDDDGTGLLFDAPGSSLQDTLAGDELDLGFLTGYPLLPLLLTRVRTLSSNEGTDAGPAVTTQQDLFALVRRSHSCQEALAACSLVQQDTNPPLLVCTICQRAVTREQIAAHVCRHYPRVTKYRLGQVLGPWTMELPPLDVLLLEPSETRAGLFRHCPALKSVPGYQCPAPNFSYATPRADTLRRHFREAHSALPVPVLPTRPTLQVQQVAPGTTARWFAVHGPDCPSVPGHHELDAHAEADGLLAHLKRLGHTASEPKSASTLDERRLRSSFIIRGRIGDYVDVCGVDAVHELTLPLTEPDALLAGLDLLADLAVDYTALVNDLPRLLTGALLSRLSDHTGYSSFNPMLTLMKGKM